MKEPLNPRNDLLITSNYNFEGRVERKCLLKTYKKPNICKWKNYWLAICEHLLFFHKQKSLLITFHMRLHRSPSIGGTNESTVPSSSSVQMTLTDADRLFYQRNPSKCQSITDCLIVLSQTKNRNEIQLSDLNQGECDRIDTASMMCIAAVLGSMYKLRFENAVVANIWYQHLKEGSACKLTAGRLSENLIALD